MGYNALRAFWSAARSLKGFWRGHFVDQHIRTLGVSNEIFRDTSISGKHYRAPCIVYPVAERWLYRRVDLQAVIFTPPFLKTTPSVIS